MTGGEADIGGLGITGGKIYGQGYEGKEVGLSFETPSSPISGYAIPTYTIRNEPMTALADIFIEKPIKNIREIADHIQEKMKQ